MLDHTWRESVARVLDTFKAPAAAEWIRKASLHYANAPTGNTNDSDSKLDGRAFDSVAARRVWTRDAFKADGTFLERHVGVNPTNALNPFDVFVSLIHAAFVGSISDALAADGKATKNDDGTLKGRVYGKEFKAAAEHIIRDFPTNMAKRPTTLVGGKEVESRFSGSKAFYPSSAEVAAAIIAEVETLPALPFHYNAAEVTAERTFTMIKTFGPSGQAYPASVKFPGRGGDDAAKKKNTAEAVDAYNRINADKHTFDTENANTVEWVDAVEQALLIIAQAA